MDYPRMVYKAPGVQGLGTLTYDCIAVDDEEELALFKGKGWFGSLPEALEAWAKGESLKRLQEMEKTEKAKIESKRPEPLKK
jgi:hypothetical protein